MTLFPNEVLKDRFKILRLQEAGSLSNIYLAVDMLATPQYRVTILELTLIDLVQTPNLTSEGKAQDYEPTTVPIYKRSPLAFRFLSDAQRYGRFNHPNLARFHDFFSEENRLYLVYQYIEGNHLEELIEQNNGKPLKEIDLLPWIGQVMDALTYCHENGAVHLNVKPVNIRISPEGKAYLVGFGLAFLYARGFRGPSLLPASKKFAYFSPEQSEAMQKPDCRSDIYTLGVTLYKALTARVPGESESPDFPIEFYHPGISERYDAVIQKAISHDPGRRYQSIEEMRTALGISPSGSHEVFISYAHEDGVIAKQICEGLEKQGMTCWLAPRDILPNYSWPEAISHGIAGSKVFLLILSQASNQSKQVAREATMGDNQGLPFLCVRVENVMPSASLSYYLSNIQWYDVFEAPDAVTIEQLINKAREISH